METTTLSRGHRARPVAAPEVAELLEQRRRNALLEGGIPPRFLEADFSRYAVRDAGAESAAARARVLDVCRAYAAGFREHAALGRGLIFTGAPGTGKTMLACAIARAVIESGRTAKYATAYRLASEVKETYGRSGERERDVIARYVAPDLLVLDEIGMQHGTDAERLTLWEALNGRYEAVRPTILVSNLTLPEMAGYVGDRILDRMRENGGATLAFRWDSFRSRGAVHD